MASWSLIVQEEGNGFGGVGGVGGLDGWVEQVGRSGYLWRTVPLSGKWKGG